MNTVRRVAIIGGNRIPFARSNTVYAHDSNQDLLVAALQGLVGQAVGRAQPRLQGGDKRTGFALAAKAHVMFAEADVPAHEPIGVQ